MAFYNLSNVNDAGGKSITIIGVNDAGKHFGVCDLACRLGGAENHFRNSEREITVNLDLSEVKLAQLIERLNSGEISLSSSVRRFS